MLNTVLQRVSRLLMSQSLQYTGLIPWIGTDPNPPFITLPPEILNEILKLLDLRTLLRVRLTCQALYHATKSRELWHDLVRMFQQRPGVSRIEGSLFDYTVDELERWVLHRHRVQHAWSLPNTPTFRRRVIDAPTRRPVVLPGGRWLLSMDKRNRVVTTDLDACQPSTKILCQVENRIEGTDYSDCPSDFAVWVDPGKPRLTCRIALLNGIFIGQEAPRNALTRVHIFEVRLEGHGSNATLVAEPLRVIQGSFKGASTCEALDDRYFIQVKRYFRCVKAFYVMNVFRYNQINASPITIDMHKIVGADIYILPHDRIILAACGSISIYAIPPNGSVKPKLTLLHTIPATLYPTQCHVIGQHAIPRIGRDFSTVVYLTWHHSMAIYIPHDPSRGPYTFRLSANKFPAVNHARAVGFFNAIAVNTFQHPTEFCLDVSTCHWDVDSSIQPNEADFSRRQFEFPDLGLTQEICGYDEGTGRIIMRSLGSFDNLLEVYDTIY